MSSTGPYLQVALEEAPNYEGASNTVSSNLFYPAFKSITDDEGMEPLEEQDIIRGFLAPMPHLGAAEYKPTIKLGGGHPRPADLGLFFSAIFGAVTPTAGDGSAVTDPDSAAVPIGAYVHEFEFTNTDPPQSLQIIGASGDGKYRKGTGFGVSELAFGYDGGALSMDVDTVGLVLESISDPSITPVVSDAYPFRRGDLTITWLSNTARTTEFDWKVVSQIEAVSEPTVASLYPNLLLYQNDAMPTVEGTIGKAAIDADDVAALEAGTQFACTIKIVGRETIKRAAVNITSSSAANPSVITCAAAHNLPAGTSSVVIAGHTGSTPAISGTYTATKIDATTFSIPVNCSSGGTGGTVVSDTAYYPTLWVEMPGCQLISLDRDPIEAKRRREGKYGWQARYDATTAKLVTVTLVNDTAAYATYA